MAVESQVPLSDTEKYEVLLFLNDYGKRKWYDTWREHISIPDDLDIKDKESVLRFLLLRALINQQADTSKVRELAKALYGRYKDDLLYRPWKINFRDMINVFKKVGGSRGSLIYRVGFLGGIKPISLFTYRYATYAFFIRDLHGKKIKFRRVVESASDVNELYERLRSDDILNAGWVGSDPKACRMLVNWITFIYNEVWKRKRKFRLEDTLMIVDGHVGKVFSRTGLLDKVRYEKNRPYIIEASKMRPDIEKMVKNYVCLIPFYVDNGAFYLFEEGYCLEEDPKCNICPLSNLCKKYTKWTGYKQYK